VLTRISIVTPSLNQGKFIERTILSVLGQKGPFDLEYIIVDGGSTDETAQIVKKYNARLTWVSEEDAGQSDAINKGLSMASGDILAWLNSDDTYEPGALSSVAKIFEHADYKWCIGNCRIIDEHDDEIRRWITAYKIFKCKGYTYKKLLTQNFISQCSVFFSKDAYRKTGALSLDCQYAMDYDYWLRIGKRFEPHYINKFLANFRWHGDSKCGKDYQKAAYEAYKIAKKHATPGNGFSLVQNYLHYVILTVLYTAYDVLPRKCAI
jgi:glycosyltransferase involved in cell wall biosynthesis